MSVLIPLDRIDDSPWQTRERYDQAHIEQLAADIKANGLLQNPVGRLVDGIGRPVALHPIVRTDQKRLGIHLEENPGHRFQLAFGHNRVRALRHLASKEKSGATAVCPVLLQPLTDQQMALMAWSENAQRKDLNPVEEARAIKKRMEDFGWTQEQAADHLGIARPTVSNKLRLLKLSNELQLHVAGGKLSERAAMALIPAFELSPEETEALESAEYYVTKPADVVKEALKGASSDRIRQSVEWMKQSAERIIERRKQDEAQRKKAEKALAKAEKTGVIDLRKITGAYERCYSTEQIPGCSAECACRRKAVTEWGDQVEICIDVKRYRELKAAAAKEEKRKRREQRERRLDKMKRKLVGPDGQPAWTPQAIRLIVENTLRYGNSKDVTDALKLMGLDPDRFADLNSYGEKAEKAARELEALSMDDALRLAVEVIVRKDIREAFEYSSHRLEKFNLLMRGKPYGAAEPSGDGAAGPVPGPAEAEPVTASAA